MGVIIYKTLSSTYLPQPSSPFSLHTRTHPRFIKGLPGGRSTRNFNTLDASGSTSQAASISESLECGSKTLLFDEDTCATNFMIRDGKMAALVDAEPITPFVSRVRGMREGGISCVLVIGGSGDYLNVADAVIGMKVRGEFKGEVEGREGKTFVCRFSEYKP